MNKRIIVVEDHDQILEICRDNGLECYDNAEDALKIIMDEQVDLVYLDVNGIQKNGVDAHAIAKTCKVKGIRVVLTTTDPFDQEHFSKEYGIEIGSKKDAMTATA